jgi:GNAT superfamily N-acetyltransferase
MDAGASGEIIEFEPGMNASVRAVVLETLGSIDFSALPRIVKVLDSPALHADLDQIPETYSGRGRFWVYRQGEAIVGTAAILELSRERAQLCRMFVLPAHQGRGVGQALLDRALEFAREQGYGEVVLESWRVLTRAHRFYERKGFVRFREDEEQFDYRLDLRPA